MYSFVTDVFEILKKMYPLKNVRGKVNGLLLLMDKFDFELTLHLMKNILDISKELSEAM